MSGPYLSPSLPQSAATTAAPAANWGDMSAIRKAIKAIKYIENETVRGAFNNCKSRFLASGIPNGERLVFHGTSAKLESIIEQSLKLSKCKRCVHGFGIYFSEYVSRRSELIPFIIPDLRFPSVSEVYGQHLLLCRVMVGNTYQGNEMKIPDGYNSKVGSFCCVSETVRCSASW